MKKQRINLRVHSYKPKLKMKIILIKKKIFAGIFTDLDVVVVVVTAANFESIFSTKTFVISLRPCPSKSNKKEVRNTRLMSANSFYMQ